MKQAFLVAAMFLLLSMVVTSVNIQLVRASGTIYIRADGSIDPPTASIQRDGDVYTFIDNVYDSIIIEKNNITIDGAGHMLQGFGSGYGFTLSGISNVTIRSTNIKGYEWAICLSDSSNNRISGNNMSDNTNGVHLLNSNHNNILDNRFNRSISWGTLLDCSHNNNLTGNLYWLDTILILLSTGNTVTSNVVYGRKSIWNVDLRFSSHNTLANNSVIGGGGGFILGDYSHYNILANNTATAMGSCYSLVDCDYNFLTYNIADFCTDTGIDVLFSCNNQFIGNQLTNNHVGMNVRFAEHNNIAQNNISHSSWYGIHFLYSCNNTIEGNTITFSSSEGLAISSSSNNRIVGNNITGNSNGVYLWYSSNNSIVGNNIADNNWNGIFLNYSSNSNSVSENNVTNHNNNGVGVDHSFGNTVQENTVSSNNNQGILLYYSSDNIVADNTVEYSGYANINVYSSHNNTIKNNLMQHHWLAFIIHYGSTQNKIFANNFDGQYAIFSNNNLFYHNNFFQSLASPNAGQNFWDSSSEGNYWSSYNGTDSNGDGIGDVPYSVDENNVDHYPLMNRYWIPGDVNHDLKIDILDVVKICAAYGATPSAPEWNPHADIAEPYGVIDIIDVVACTIHYGEKWP